MIDGYFRPCEKKDWKVLFPLALERLPPEVTFEVGAFLFRECLEGTYVFVSPEGEMIGYWMIHPKNDPNVVWLEQIAVASKFQGKGHGTTLLNHAQATCEKWGYRRIEMTVLKKNSRSVAMSRRCGYETLPNSDESDIKFTFAKDITPDKDPEARPLPPHFFKKLVRKIYWEIMLRLLPERPSRKDTPL